MTKPLLFAPAMNTYMWNHPITRVQIEKLKEFGYKELPPVVKKLACGDFGNIIILLLFNHFLHEYSC